LSRTLRNFGTELNIFFKFLDSTLFRCDDTFWLDSMFKLYYRGMRGAVLTETQTSHSTRQ